MRSYDWIDYSSGFGKDKQIAFCSVRQTVKHQLNTECRKSDKIKLKPLQSMPYDLVLQ